MNESYHSSRTTPKPKKVPLVKSIVACAKNRTPWTVQACVEACACDRTPDTTRTVNAFQKYFQIIFDIKTTEICFIKFGISSNLLIVLPF